MKKKQASLYSIPEQIKTIPHLKPEEIRQFENQFTLFDEEIEVSKIRDALNIIQKNEEENYKQMQIFITELSQRKSKCTFSQYYAELIKYFQKQNLSDIIIDTLCGSKHKMTESLFKDILSQTLGYELKKKEVAEIMNTVFDYDTLNFKEGIPFEKIAEVLENVQSLR